jgi:aryl-alcohol dehydrogenase-like predicted oxidoreductase
VDFTHRELRVIGKRVYRLGLAGNYGIDEKGVRAAIERGMNYLYLTTRGPMAKPLRDALAKDRDKLVVATGPLVGWFGGSVRRAAERNLKKLGTEYIDIFQLPWLGVASTWSASTLKELEHLKTSGKVRALGVSIHDRARAGKLAEDSPLDVLMIRYNAAHPGAERDIFPHLEKRKPNALAQAPEGTARLEGQRDDGRRLLPVLSLERSRRRHAHRPGEPGAARRESRSDREGTADERGRRLDARVR